MGFKKSRTEFGDVYANSLIGSGGNSSGSGVLVTNVAQQFDQGNISFTDNALDLAINGSGFFVLNEPSGAPSYTRAGYFGLDSEGFIVSNNGSLLQGLTADTNGNISGGNPTDLQVDTSNLPPQKTGTVELEFNLDSQQTVPAVGPFDPANPLTFNSSTSLTVYDSQGQSHVLTNYFVKTADNTWDMHNFVDNVDSASAAYPITFNSDGTLDTGATTLPFTVDNWNPGNGTDVPPGSAFTVDIAGSTQFGSDFSVSDLAQNGFSPGKLTGIEIDNSGILFARYTNGEALTLGQIVLASFDNVQGLSPLGDTAWGESFESGIPSVGVPQSGSLGSVQAGSLEESNVDLSEELVRLIIAQRNFQANAKTIETADTVTQAIINIR
ncbi:MAG: flagellar hook protein FlgE [Oceanicoccus sp.]|jgi:flagellar hook protein FlgE